MQDQMDQSIEQLRKELRQLGSENNQLKHEVKRLQERVAQLENANRRLQEQLEQAQAATARQAAPFRREQQDKVRPEKQKPPGRKPGHPGNCRQQPDHIDETIEMPLDNCPHCLGPVTDVNRIEQIIEEIPPIRPHVVRLITYSGTCQKCGQVRSSHPLQTSVGQGAAKVQLGPRALALAASLKAVHGLTMRKSCTVLKDLSASGGFMWFEYNCWWFIRLRRIYRRHFQG